jgi:hypothetical protein
MVSKDEVATAEFTCDSMGNPTEILTLDATGKPVLNKEGLVALL